MCGRKTLTKGKLEILEELAIDEWEEDFDPSFNIAPTHKSPILRNIQNKRVVNMMNWGLIPSWSKDSKFAAKMINARSETLFEKPSFKRLIPRQRCIVISDGYFEWQKTSTGKIPHYIHSKDHSLMQMAGLWDMWKPHEGPPLLSYTVITTTPSDQLSHIHHRMPVILTEKNVINWLGNAIQSNEIADLLKPYPHDLDYYPVSTFVNYAANNSPECIKDLDHGN